jgi:signal transduction histidine kinase
VDTRPLALPDLTPEATDVLALAGQTDRLRTELEVALEMGQISVWRHDLASHRLWLDARGCGVIGVPFSAQGITLAEARARIHPEDVALAAASAALTLRTGQPSDMELRYPAGTGTGTGWKHVLLRRALQRGADGAVLGFVGVLLDVTARVEDSRRALEAARRLEAAAEAARIGLWSTTPDSPVPVWSGRMARLLGLEAHSQPLPLSTWLQRCLHADDRARVQAQILAWWRRGQGRLETEFRIVRPSDGALRWLLMRGDVARRGADALRLAEGVLMDTTEQHHTLRQLRQTVERMSMTTSALGLGTWEADPLHRQTTWDAQMFRLRGVESPARPVTRADIASFVHPDDRAQTMAVQAAQLLDGEPWHREFRVMRPDGQVRWITSQSVMLLDEHGVEDRRIGVNWDSTDTHVAAEALRQRERALAESQAKSAAMSRISHELRTPLNAVLGFTQLLRSTQGTIDNDRRDRWLAHIEDAGRHLLALIDDVLDLSRAEVGELRLTTQALPLAAFVEATLPLLAGEAQAAQVVLCCGQLPGTVLADPVRLRQVLINLVSNAIKYNRPDGRVTISSDPLGAMLALRVVDNGLGIATDQLTHAFEPFNRLGAEATAVAGSGIGLAIVKVLVEHMGGTVTVNSQLGFGSEFVVSLPAAAPP